MAGLARAIAAGLMAAAALSGQDGLSNRLLQQAENSLVLVLTFDRSGKLLHQGAGFELGSPPDVITTDDVVRGAVHARVITLDRREFTVNTVIKDISGSGLTRLLVTIPDYAQRGVAVMGTQATTGDPVDIPWIDAKGNQALLSGRVIEFRYAPSLGPYYRISLTIPEGTPPLGMGLPVLNMKGELVGVITRRLVDSGSVYFAMPVSRIPRRAPAEDPLSDGAASRPFVP